MFNIDVSTRNWYLYDQRENRGLGFRADYRREIASLTKIMTTIVAIEVIERYNIAS